MKHFAFVIWMLGWPVCAAVVALLEQHERILRGRVDFSKSTHTISTALNLGVWIIVAFILYWSAK